MSAQYVIEETTVRETGESAVYALGELIRQDLLLTLGITHAVEYESLDLQLYFSEDGRRWEEKPLICFAKKYYCGTYQMLLPRQSGPFVKAVWSVSRWGRTEGRPFFRFYLFAQAAHVHAMAGAA